MSIQNITTYSFKDIFSLSLVQFEKACVFNKPEKINLFSIYWIKKGEGTYNIDFKSYTFNDNVLFFLSPGQVLTIDSEKVKEAYKITFERDFYCIDAHDKEISCNGLLFNNVFETSFFKPSKKETEKMSFILDNLIDEFNTENTGQYDMLQAYLKQFIILSVRIKKENFIIKNNIEIKLFKDFSLLVEQNYKTLHSVTEYAKRLGLSPKSLTKNFQKRGILTPSDFIKNRIVLEAKRQLIYSNNSVKKIAYDLGFNDSAYFTRFFKKATSKSPVEFKKSQNVLSVLV